MWNGLQTRTTKVIWIIRKTNTRSNLMRENQRLIGSTRLLTEQCSGVCTRVTRVEFIWANNQVKSDLNSVLEHVKSARVPYSGGIPFDKGFAQHIAFPLTVICLSGGLIILLCWSDYAILLLSFRPRKFVAIAKFEQKWLNAIQWKALSSLHLMAKNWIQIA